MRVLVAVSSKHGATAEIGMALAQAIERDGVTVDVGAPREIGDVTGYDAIVLGSSVYAGHWNDEAKHFVDRFGPALASRAVWLFSSGPIGDPPQPDQDPADVAVLMAATHAHGHKVFAGKVDKSKLGLGERAIVRALKVPEGDFRDWTAIATWGEEIARSLSAEERCRSADGAYSMPVVRRQR